MTNKDKYGIIAAIIFIVAVIIGMWALMKVIILLIPVIIVAALIGLYEKYVK
jgi:uncharacterized membrane protein